MKICEASGRKPTDELRDLIDEALQLRLEPASARLDLSTLERPGLDNEEIARLAEDLRQVLEKSDKIGQLLTRMMMHQREQYAMILETLAGAYGARYLVWKYVAEPALYAQGMTREQIRQRYLEEGKIWNAERDKAADMIEEGIRNLLKPQ